MSRGKKRDQKPVVPDSKYGSELISRFINIVMLDGKKSVAEAGVYNALGQVEKKLIEKYGNVVDGFKEVILLLGPTVQTKARRIGGATFQVPVEVPDYKRLFMGMTILRKAVRKKSGMSFAKALAIEIADAMEEKGEAFKEKITIQKMAMANKAYAHLA